MHKGDSMSKTYTTIQGDMWDSVSYKVYGTEKYMDVLMQNNPEYMDIFIFGAGTVLVIPELKENTATDLPSWRN